MNIELYTITYNEEKILPFFLDHYSNFCDIINVYDNMSTDKTLEILNNFDRCKINIIPYDTNSKLDDSVYLDIKNNCWKNSSADYTIIVDADEFLYHPNIIDFLKNTDEYLYRPLGYDMWSEKFPQKDILNEINMGIRSINYDKICIFNPNEIKQINYSLGCHQANPILNYGGGVDITIYDDLKLLHYKNISFDYRYNKHQEYLKRLSKFNIDTGSGIHYTFSEKQQYEEFENISKKIKKII
jgi:glycosyltransferase involved in cell wall biosynthesis